MKADSVLRRVPVVVVSGSSREVDFARAYDAQISTYIVKPPAVDADPGRFRNTAFFTKMYGDCQMGQVTPRLASLAWLPKVWGKSIRITSLNGVDEHLRAVAADQVIEQSDLEARRSIGFRRPGEPMTALAPIVD